jgi:hypothetical protein
MRIMRTKVVDSRELWYSAESVLYVYDAIGYRVDDLTSTSTPSFSAGWYVDSFNHVGNFSQQRLDPEKQFESFAYGIASYFLSFWTVSSSDVLVVQFKYFHNENALWSANYVRSLNPSVIEYNDPVEDQNVKPEDVLSYEYSDELPFDYWVYDGHSINDTPNYRSVEPPLKDMYVLDFVCVSSFQSTKSCRIV